MKYILTLAALALLVIIYIKWRKPKRRSFHGKELRNKGNNSTSSVISDVEKLGLKGHVKYLKDVYWFVSIKDDLVVEGEPFDYSIIQEFDRNGYLVDNTIENNNPYYKNVDSSLLYDDAGNLIEEKKYKDDGKLLWKKNFNYDQNNRLLEWVNFNIEGIGLGKITFEYDINNEKTYSKLYKYDESLFGKLIYEYDTYGNCIKEYKEDTLCNPIMVKRDIVYYEV